MIFFDLMAPPQVSLDRLLQEKHARKEGIFKYITGRVAIEDLAPIQMYRWLVDWMNQQLSDIGVNSTGGRLLPPIHFDLVEALDNLTGAYVLEADKTVFIIVTRPMVEEMLRLSDALVFRNRAFMNLQIAPDANFREIAQLLLFMQFCLVTAHEYSHVVRGHWDDDQPLEIGESLSQAQEFDADGYGIYHDLTYFFHGRGRLFASDWLKVSSGKALENSILDCFLLSMLLQFCARWAGRIQVELDVVAEHPPHPMRIEYSILFVEMWCREVGKISTSWMTDGTLNRHFAMVASLFPADVKRSWNPQLLWLKGVQSEHYRNAIRRSFDRLRTGNG
jgi:hypothetical protein